MKLETKLQKHRRTLPVAKTSEHAFRFEAVAYGVGLKQKLIRRTTA